MILETLQDHYRPSKKTKKLFMPEPYVESEDERARRIEAEKFIANSDDPDRYPLLTRELLMAGQMRYGVKYRVEDKDLIELSELNRELNETNLRKISRSMDYKDLLCDCPVRVKLEVVDGEPHLFAVDGQHTKTMATLKNKVFYVMLVERMLEKDVALVASSSTSWTGKVFIDTRSRNGDANYQAVSDFQAKFGFRQTTALKLLTGSILGGGESHPEMFRFGQFRVTTYEPAQVVGEMIDDFSKVVGDIARINSFVQAVVHVMLAYSYPDDLVKIGLCNGKSHLMECKQDFKTFSTILARYCHKVAARRERQAKREAQEEEDDSVLEVVSVKSCTSSKPGSSGSKKMAVFGIKRVDQVLRSDRALRDYCEVTTHIENNQRVMVEVSEAAKSVAEALVKLGRNPHSVPKSELLRFAAKQLIFNESGPTGTVLDAGHTSK